MAHYVSAALMAICDITIDAKVRRNAMGESEDAINHKSTTAITMNEDTLRKCSHKLLRFETKMMLVTETKWGKERQE